MLTNTLLKWSVALLVAFSLIGGCTAYCYHQGAVAERQKALAAQVQLNKTLQVKYNLISTSYEALKKQNTIKAQDNKQQEDRMIDANKDYYSTDVFDVISLQHIQRVQLNTNTP